MNSSSTVNTLLAAASGPVRRNLKLASEIAGRLGVSAWLVGGAVRDLLIARSAYDLDLVVLGNWLPFASELSRCVGGRLILRPGFLTAFFASQEGFAFDIVRARSEVYPAVAVLPSVRPGTLREDLFRRDFTINAMALPLAKTGRNLADPFGGQRDLDKGLLRILHDRSFIDDPGRIFRGISMAARFGMRFEERTFEAAACAIAEGALARLSRERLRSGLELVLSDPRTAATSIETLTNLGIDCALHPELKWGDATVRRLRRLSGLLVDIPETRRWLVILLGLTWELRPGELREMLSRLAIEDAFAGELVAAQETARHASRRLETLDSAYERFKLGESLDGIATALALSCGEGPLRSFLGNELQTLQAKRLQLRGQDLVQLDFAPGPLIGRALEATLRARMDGEIGRAEEASYAIRWLQARLHRAESGVGSGSVGADRDSPRGGGGS